MDSNAIRAAIQKFTFEAAPSSGDSSAPATVGDIKKIFSISLRKEAGDEQLFYQN